MRQNTSDNLCVSWDEDVDLTIRLPTSYFIEFQVYDSVKGTHGLVLEYMLIVMILFVASNSIIVCSKQDLVKRWY